MLKPRHIPSCALVLASTLMAAPASSQEATSKPQARQSSQDESAEAFARKAATGGRAEVELAAVARQRASGAAVKQLAQRIETDHMQANAELKALANAKGWHLDEMLDAKHAALKSRLEMLEGQAFDRAYLDAMHHDHTADIAAFRKQAQSGSDAQLKAFASKTLPHLEEHLRLTEQARRTGGNSNSQP